MKSIEVARQVLSVGAMAFRPRKDEPGQYDCKPWFTGNHRGWTLLDSFSASAIVAVYDALNETNRERYIRLRLVSMAKLAFKFVK